jgi:hypothetical protein
MIEYLGLHVLMIFSKALRNVQATETASVLVGSKKEKQAVLRQVPDPANYYIQEIKVHRHRVNAPANLLRSRSLLFFPLNPEKINSPRRIAFEIFTLSFISNAILPYRISSQKPWVQSVDTTAKAKSERGKKYHVN